LLRNYQKLGCLMNYKLHFLHSHLDYFPLNLGDYNEEQGTISRWTISSRYQRNGTSLPG